MCWWNLPARNSRCWWLAKFPDPESTLLTICKHENDILCINIFFLHLLMLRANYLRYVRLPLLCSPRKHDNDKCTQEHVGRETPLGRPRSIYKTDIECHLLESPNELEGQVQWPSFSISADRTSRCILGANLVIIAQIQYKLSCRQAKFPRILSQNGKNYLEGQGPPSSSSSS